MSALSPHLKVRSTGQAAGAHVIVDKAQAANLLAAAELKNADVKLAAHHPHSDKAVEPFVGLAVLEKGGDFVRFEYAPRPLGDEDVEVDIQFCGVCGSDLHTVDSGWGHAKYPVITGHEIVGKVSKIGSKVTRMKVGDVAGIGAEVLTCRQCVDCKSKNDAYCTKKTYTYNAVYYDGQWAFGGYANKVRVNQEWVFVIPKELDPAEAAPLLCAGVTVFAPLQRHVKAGQHVGVVGIGGLGHLGVQYAAKMGAKVTAISTSLRKKDDAVKLGASEFLVSTDSKQMEAAARSFDAILLTANPDDLNLSPLIGLLKVGGFLILMGSPEKPMSFHSFSIIGNRSNIVGSLIGSKHEVQEALDFAAKHGVRAVIEKFPIEKANDAFKKMRDNTIRYRPVLELPIH